MNYPLVEKEAIVGLWSWYRDASDDRYWKVKVCDFGQHEYANEGYMNEYDNSLMYKCPYGMHIYKIGTSFDSGDNDRRWRFYCRSGNNRVNPVKTGNKADLYTPKHNLLNDDVSMVLYAARLEPRGLY